MKRIEKQRMERFKEEVGVRESWGNWRGAG